MILICHEIRQSAKALLIWSLSVGFFIAVCVFLYPDIADEMESASKLFAAMGAFSRAFGMDRLSMGSLIGFYAVECGAVLGLGGALFAALTGATALSREERDHTAEFLLAHPLRRGRIVREKLAALVLLVLLLNLIVFALSVLSIWAVGESVSWRDLCLLHGANLLMHLEIAGLCFGLSAWLRRGGAGIGLGLAAGLYFLNLAANISEKAALLNFVTPFAYTDGADLLLQGQLDLALFLPGMAYAALAVGLGWRHYVHKDIHA